MSTPFVIETTLNAPSERVWQALTNKEKMKQWYFTMQEFRPEVGFEFTFEGGIKEKTYVHRCRILEVMPGNKLRHTWTYDGYPGSSIVTIELFPEGEKTKIKLTHEGLETFRTNGPDFPFESFAKGWTHIIGKSLIEYLEQ
jgi:uncharacterized protein YndB with AHSA1/START domain